MIAAHYPAIVPGGFLVVNIADILCFKDPAMPKVQAEADPGDKVLDCFMGSGTTAVAALTEDRLFIGIDIEQKSVTLANRQIKKATPAQLILLKP